MISLLKDPRPTRSVGQAMNGGVVLRNCDVALEIIESIANRKFDSRTTRGSYLSTASEDLRDEIIEEVKSWWEQNKDSINSLTETIKNEGKNLIVLLSSID